MGLNVPLAFYEMHKNNVKQLSNFYAFPLQSKCEVEGVVQTIVCKYLSNVSWILGLLVPSSLSYLMCFLSDCNVM
jgi:hypothetical protein